jgi:hypothetical protein
MFLFVLCLFQALSGLLKKVSGVRVVGCHFVCQAAKRLFTLNVSLLNLTLILCFLPTAYCLLPLPSAFLCALYGSKFRIQNTEFRTGRWVVVWFYCSIVIGIF